MKSLSFRLAVITIAALAILAPVVRPSASTVRARQTGPTLMKATIVVRANRLLHYWKAPEVDNYWSWMPEVSFLVVGPVNTGSAFAVDFTNEAGAPWYSVECETNQIPAGQFGRISTPAVTTHVDKRTTLATGTFGFAIRMKNELTGTNETLFKGRYKVGKFHVGNSQPQFKNQFEYFVDQDWNLPIGYLYFDYANDQNMPPLVVSMWFRGALDDTKVAAYLFYNGKQIASTKQETGRAASDAVVLTNGNDQEPRWERWRFGFWNVRGYNLDTSSANNTSQIFFLNKNPGEYEVKVLRDGDLVRTTKFTVGADGRLVDNGLAQKNNLGGLAMILPVKVLGDADGHWDAAAWKTEAFYGNPLDGFAAP
jgi:hypothetical protein